MHRLICQQSPGSFSNFAVLVLQGGDGLFIDVQGVCDSQRQSEALPKISADENRDLRTANAVFPPEVLLRIFGEAICDLPTSQRSALQFDLALVCKGFHPCAYSILYENIDPGLTLMRGAQLLRSLSRNPELPRARSFRFIKGVSSYEVEMLTLGQLSFIAHYFSPPDLSASNDSLGPDGRANADATRLENADLRPFLIEFISSMPWKF